MNESGSDPAAWRQPDESRPPHQRRRGLANRKPAPEATTAGDMDTPDLTGSTEIDGEYTNIVITRNNDDESGDFGQRKAAGDRQ